MGSTLLAGFTLRVLTAAIVMVLVASGAAPHPQSEGASSEEVDTSFVGSVQVSVVNVDVYVTDREGNPVTGLTAEDFEVLEDGKPVEVTNFYAVENGRPAGPPPVEPVAADTASAPPPVEPAPELPPEQRLRLVVFVDNFNLRPLERNRVLSDLRTFLLSELGRDDEVLLVTYDRALRVQHPFTRDHHKLADTLLELSDTSGFRVPRDNERGEALKRIDEATSASAALRWARNFAESQYNELTATVSAMREFLDSLAGLPGRKAILHVSSGVPMVPGQELFEAVDIKFPNAGALMEMARYDASREFERLAVQASSHRVSFYTLDAGGLRPDVVGSAEYRGMSTPGARGRIDSAVEANLQSSLRYLADQTGGRAIVNRNETLPPLRQVGAALQSYYSLGYNERNVGDGRYHRIRVKVNRSGVQVRHRDGYRSRSGNDRMADRVRAALSYAFDDNPLEIEARPETALLQTDGRYVVPVRVRIPLEHVVLLPRPNGAHEARLRLFVAVVDEKGRASGVEEVPLGFRLAEEHLETARGESFLYTHKLLMRAGRQKLALGVLDEIGAEHAILSLPVQAGEAR